MRAAREIECSSGGRPPRVAEPLGDALRHRRRGALGRLGRVQEGAFEHGEVGRGPGAEILGGDGAAGGLVEIGVDVLRGDAVPRTSGPMYLNSSEPGRSRQFARMRASFGSVTTLWWRMPCLAPKSSSMRPPAATRTWSLRRVVRPKVSFCLAYSGLPTRARLPSISRTTAARTLSRGTPSRVRSVSTRRRRRGSARPQLRLWSNLVSSRTWRQRG